MINGRANAQNQFMENETKPIEQLIASLQKDAQKRNTALVVEARIAVGPERLRLLEVQPVVPLAVIHY